MHTTNIKKYYSVSIILFLLGLQAATSTFILIGPIKAVHITALILILFLFTFNRHLIQPQSAVFWPTLLAITCCYGVLVTYCYGFPLSYGVILGQFGSIILMFFSIILFKKYIFRKVFAYGYVCGTMIVNILILFCSLFSQMDMILQTLLGSSLFLHTKYGIRATGFFENPNFFASTLLIGTSLTICLLINKSKSIFLWIICLLPYLISLVLAQSRSAFVGLGFLLLGYYWLSTSSFFKRTVLIVSVLIPCLIVFGIVFQSTHEVLPNNIGKLKLSRLASGDFGFNLEKDRFFIYESNLKSIWHWPLGVGYTSTGDIVGVVTHGALAKGGHNFILGYLVRFGLFFGWTFIAFWIWCPLRLIFYVLKNQIDIKIRKELAAYIGGMGSVIITNLAHSMFGWIYAMIFWCLAIGCYLETKEKNSVIR